MYLKRTQPSVIRQGKDEKNNNSKIVIMGKLKNKVALVTGSGKGIGRSIAIRLAKAGASIALNDLPESSDILDKLNKLLKGYGVEVLNTSADVSDQDQVGQMFQKIMGHFGKLDILVNNAGTSQDKDIYEISLEEWNQIINNNLTSCYLCSKQAMQIMRQNKFGRIVNISSVVAQQGALKGHVHYASSKSGMLGLMKTLARTGASDNITVNAVAPGVIETTLLKQIHGEEGIAEIAENIPLGIGKPKDVAMAVLYLVSPAGSYLTGATIDVNGGLYMR